MVEGIHGDQITVRLIDPAALRRIAEDGLARINVSLPLDAIVDTLSTADRQLIAIDAHINDPAFAEAAVHHFRDITRGQ